MSKDMKLIYENYRVGNLLEEKDLFERHEHIEHALGFKPVLNESGESQYTPEMKSQIIEANRNFSAFFDNFNPKKIIQKFGKETGQLFTTLYSIIKNPKYIPDFIKAARRKIINGWIRKIIKVKDFLNNNSMPNFAKPFEKVLDGINKVNSMQTNWKKAIATTGLIIGVSYLFDKLEGLGMNLLMDFDQLKDQLTKKILTAVENFLINEFPKIALKLYGGMGTIITGYGVFVVAAVAVLKVVNIARQALAPLFDRYKELTRRRDNRDAGTPEIQFEGLQSLQETFIKNIGVIK